MPPSVKPKNLIVTDACLIDGEHTEIDTVLRGVAANDARDLLSSGRLREAVDEADMAAAEKRAEDRAAAAEKPASKRAA